MANTSHVMLNEVNKLSMLHTLESRFRYEFSFVFVSLIIKHDKAFELSRLQLNWKNLDLFSLLCKSFARKSIMKATKTYFDHYKLTNLKLYLNSEFYPYDLNLDFNKYKITVLYDIYIYIYIYIYRETLLSMKNFLHGYIHVIIYCSQNEFIKSSTVDVRLEFEFKENVIRE